MQTELGGAKSGAASLPRDSSRKSEQRSSSKNILYSVRPKSDEKMILKPHLSLKKKKIKILLRRACGTDYLSSTNPETGQ